ncbi:MAG: AraC family transcriptional regulator [Clostridia bacterium]|nr:AraC family transcriptional regulator [Clostridia bacterium]
MSILRTYDQDGFYLHYSFDYTPDPTDFWTHFHARYELLYVKKGKGRFICDGRVYRLFDGAVFLIKRGEVHRMEIDPTYPYERMVFNFDHTLIDSVDRTGLLFEPFGKDHIVYTETTVTEVLDKLAGISPDVVGEGFRVRAASILLSALSEIAAVYQREDKSLYDIGDMTGEHMSVRLAVKYIHDHLFLEMTLDDIAKAAFMSKSHISRLFRETTGKTIWGYITVKRLIAAKRMLSRGEPPAEVAAACGFRHYSTFWRSYQKVFGTSPTEERKNLSAGEPFPC